MSSNNNDAARGVTDEFKLYRKEVGRRLVALRNVLGFTQSQQSRNMDISVASLCNYEKGYSVPALHPFGLMIVARCGVTLDYIYRGSFDGVPSKLADDLRKELAKLPAPEL